MARLNLVLALIAALALALAAPAFAYEVEITTMEITTMITLPRLLTPRRTRRGPAPPSAPIKAPKSVHPLSISGISRECPSVSSDPPALDSRRRSDGLTYPFTDLFTFPSSPLQHPCGADKYVAMENYKTCALTETAIMAVDEYKTAEHVVACPSAVCETKCTASGPPPASTASTPPC